jgi:hypothetical protein
MFAEGDRIERTEGPEVHLRIAMEDMVKDLSNQTRTRQRGKRQRKTKCCESSEAIQIASFGIS